MAQVAIATAEAAAKAAADVRPRPTLVNGNTGEPFGPAFDPAAMLAEVKREPRQTYIAGDGLDPIPPVYIPAHVAAKIDGLLGLYADHEAAMDADDAAVDAVEEYEVDARTKRAERAAAFKAAARAAAAGKPRPKIPAAPSDADEAAELAVLRGVVDIKRQEADAIARRINALVGDHGEMIAAQAATEYAPALARLEAALTEIRAAYDDVWSARSQTFAGRTLKAARDARVPAGSPAFARIHAAFEGPATPVLLRRQDERHAIPTAFGELASFINYARSADLHTAPDWEFLPGGIQQQYFGRRLAPLDGPANK
ncbi:hypothetical protein [Micromonospora sp. NPDC005806]|uniref:hypothetical protein n=1 Tax=Micromonospora sp. NPDC005806 TaxID=3364234 RepID=UPI0036743813